MHVICNPLLRANRHQNVPEVCTLVFVTVPGSPPTPRIWTPGKKTMRKAKAQYCKVKIIWLWQQAAIQQATGQTLMISNVNYHASESIGSCSVRLLNRAGSWHILYDKLYGKPKHYKLFKAVCKFTSLVFCLRGFTQPNFLANKLISWQIPRKQYFLLILGRINRRSLR